MIKQSSLLKWTQTNKSSSRGLNKNWIHPPEALQRGHVAYLVKFLGNTEVDQPKGIDVVKEGIRKLKFNQYLKKAEGAKTPKVELTISVDGVAVQDPKSKKIFHQYPLHRISYCADDKSDKKFFSFIAKEADSERHNCFVFVSDKLAEEITLTIGQAFDLAYRRFLETSGRDLEMRKQLMIFQKRVQELEKENTELLKRIADLQNMKDRTEVEKYKKHNNLHDMALVNGTSGEKPATANLTIQPPPALPPRTNGRTASNSTKDLLDLTLPAVPTVGNKLENLFLDDFEDFNPRADNGIVNGNGHIETNGVNLVHNNNNNSSLPGKDGEKDLFGCTPFVPAKPQSNSYSDPFGMGDFSSANLGAQELESAIGAIDKKLSEMRDGFSRGLSFGNDDFSLENLDPLNNKLH